MKINKVNIKIAIAICLITSFLFEQAVAQTTAEVTRLQQRWAEVNYQLEGKTQLSAFIQLINDAEALTIKNPESAELWVWSGIIKSAYAGAKGGLGALGFAKKAKTELEKAMTINADALSGSAYTSLGTLYFKVPGWPVGFGDDDKAEELLKKALTLNPGGIDINYFYGSYLVNEKRYAEAREHFYRAQKAEPRMNRPVADAGRQKDIILALEEIQDK